MSEWDLDSELSGTIDLISSFDKVISCLARINIMIIVISCQCLVSAVFMRSSDWSRLVHFSLFFSLSLSLSLSFTFSFLQSKIALNRPRQPASQQASKPTATRRWHNPFSLLLFATECALFVCLHTRASFDFVGISPRSSFFFVLVVRVWVLRACLCVCCCCFVGVWNRYDMHI